MRTSLAAALAVGILSLGAVGCGSGADEDEPTASPRAPGAFFGVAPQSLLTDEDLDRMDQGKVGTIRLMVPWGALAPEADTAVNYSSIDPVVINAAETGIRIVLTIYGTPPWVAEGLDDYDCDPGCGPYAPTSAKALAAWKDFVGEVVDRYGPNGELWATHPDVDPVPVRSWQVWNEQNSPNFYQPKVDPGSYERVLAAAADVIRSHDPHAEVILGGMFGTPFKGKPPALSAPDFLSELYAIDGARENFDAVASHPYAPRKAKIEQQVRMLHDGIVDAGDDAGLWITEVGASSGEGDDCEKPCPLERGPEGQAELLGEAFEFFLAQRQKWGIEGVTWYSWRDTSDPNQCDWCPDSGLFEEKALTPKPAWEAYLSFSGGS